MRGKKSLVDLVLNTEAITRVNNGEYNKGNLEQTRVISFNYRAIELDIKF